MADLARTEEVFPELMFGLVLEAGVEAGRWVRPGGVTTHLPATSRRPTVSHDPGEHRSAGVDRPRISCHSSRSPWLGEADMELEMRGVNYELNDALKVHIERRLGF